MPPIAARAVPNKQLSKASSLQTPSLPYVLCQQIRNSILVGQLEEPGTTWNHNLLAPAPCSIWNTSRSKGLSVLFPLFTTGAHMLERRGALRGGAQALWILLISVDIKLSSNS